MTRTCLDCSAPVTRNSTTGRCRACALAVMRADPDWERGRLEAHAAKMRDPQYRRNISKAISKWRRERLERDPEYAEHCRQVGARLKATGLGNAAQPKGSATRRAVGQKLSDQRLGWCPREYRDLYQHFRRTMGKGSAKARRMVERQIAEDKDKLTYFERQMMKVKAGAGIIEVRPIRRAEPLHSPYGNGSAMCVEAAL